jgi:hypothetical protein
MSSRISRKQNQSKKNKSKKSKSKQQKGPRVPRLQGLEYKQRGLEVVAPVAKSQIRTTRKPKMETMPNGDCRISHREYIVDIVAKVAGPPTTFNATQFAVNPGQQASFPWLSRVATNYESYVFNSLRFCYETEAPSSLGGTLVMALDYDASDPAPTTKQQAMSYRSSVRSAPWSACCHTSLAEDLHKAKTNFIRIGAQPANTDIKTYDIGNLYVISQGVGTSGATLGELYVEYDVVLMTPVYENSSDEIIIGAYVAGVGAQTIANPFGDGETQVAAASVGITCDSKSRLTFANPGAYVFSVEFGGTTITNDLLTPSDTNIVVSQQFFLKNSTSTTAMSLWTVRVAVPNSSMVYSIAAASSTSTTAYISTLPAGLV